MRIAGKEAAIRVTGMPGKHVPPGPGNVAGKLNDLLGAVSLVLSLSVMALYFYPLSFGVFLWGRGVSKQASKQASNERRTKIVQESKPKKS